MTYLTADIANGLVTFDIIGDASELTFVDVVKFIRNQLGCSLSVAVPAARLLRSIGSITVASEELLEGPC